jgi:hypothetical protein
MTPEGAALDLRDGGVPVPLTPETAGELLGDVQPAIGKSGSGSRPHGEHRPPPKTEPPPFDGMISVNGDGTARVNVTAYDKLTLIEKRQFQERNR